MRFLLVFMLITAVTTAAEIPPVIRLWPGAAPGSENITFQEKITERSHDPQKPDRIYTHIVEPSLAVYRPAQPNGAAVIIAPGGAYTRIVIDKEGPDTSAWLNGLGVTAFVLKYRLPPEGHEHGEIVALQDAQRAIRVVRAHASEWGLDPKRIGFLGYSAGGHLAATLEFYFDRASYPPVDEVDHQSARPDFSVLGYPMTAPLGPPTDPSDPVHRLFAELPLQVRPGVNYPPSFIFQADDDNVVSPAGTAAIYATLHQAKVPAELHVFLRGGHGFGIRDAHGPNAQWPGLCAAWMQEIGVLKK